MCGETAPVPPLVEAGRRSWRAAKGVCFVIVQLDRPRGVQRHDDQAAESQSANGRGAAHSARAQFEHSLSWDLFGSGHKGLPDRKAHADRVHLSPKKQKRVFSERFTPSCPRQRVFGRSSPIEWGRSDRFERWWILAA